MISGISKSFKGLKLLELKSVSLIENFSMVLTFEVGHGHQEN